MSETYKDIDLDDDPCIFPSCEHILTKSNLDGMMDMESHYNIADDGTITGIRTSSAPLSSGDLKRCPLCRNSFRSIARYGRLVKRALLDESSRRLLMWAQKEYLALEEALNEAELEFSEPKKQCTVKGKLELGGDREKQLRRINKLPGFSTVFKKAIQLRKNIAKFAGQVQKEEQPYQRVDQMVQNVRRRKGLIAQALPKEVSTIHFGHHNLALSLALRCDLALFTKVISSHQAGRTKLPNSAMSLYVDFSPFRADCLALAEAAESAKQPAAMAEGHLLFGRFAALEMSVPEAAKEAEPEDDTSDGDTASDGGARLPNRIAALRRDGLHHLDVAEAICKRYPGQTSVAAADLEPVRRMLQGFFQSEVSNEERRAVLAAMQNEFRGTGHW